MYAPPEVLNRRPTDSKQDEKVDVYAWGVLRWEVLSGERPHMSYLKPPAGASPAVVRLQQRCTAEDPAERPTSAELEELLEKIDDAEGMQTPVDVDDVGVEELDEDGATEPAEPAVGGPVSPRTADADVLRRWRDQCPELRALWRDADVRTWTEVTFGERGHGAAAGRVVKIVLMGMGLTGEVPAALGKLAALKLLNLGGNHLTGSVPAALGQLAALKYLYLNNDQLMSVSAALFQQLRDRGVDVDLDEGVVHVPA